MERLTKIYPSGAWGIDGEIDDAIHRLAAIEDILGDDYDLDRLRELAQADRDGRCVVLPVRGYTDSRMREYNMRVQLDDGAYMPERAHATDAGLDLRAREDKLVPPKGSATFDTGVHVELPPGTVGLLKSKSGLNVRNDLTSEGVIDVGYTGSIVVKLYNHGEKPYRVKRGDKISQLVVLPVLLLSPVEVDALPETDRGADGFGSTGR